MSERADVVVVGGGIIGVSIAHALSVRGVRTILLEADKLASGTTGASFAWLNATAKADDEAYHRLNVAGLGRHLELATEWGEDAFGLAGSGSLHWSFPGAEDAPRDLMARAETLAGWGYPVVRLDRQALAALEPRIDFPEGSSGFLAPLDRWLDAPRATRRLAEEARANGADLREGTEVSGMLFEGDRVVGVTAPPFRIFAPQVVLAAGTAVPSLVAMARRSLERVVPVRPMPGLLVDTRPDERRWVNHVVYFPDGTGFHMRPSGCGGVSVGADDIDQTYARGADPGLTTGATALLHRASTFLPGFPALEAIAGADVRIGVRPMPEDGLPVVGRLADVETVYVIATHSGITLGPHLGNLVAAELCGEPQPVLDRYRPDRFAR